MALYQIVLRLARNPGFPDGDNNQRYTLVAPLDAQDRLDPVEWRLHREVCKSCASSLVRTGMRTAS